MQREERRTAARSFLRTGLSLTGAALLVAVASVAALATDGALIAARFRSSIQHEQRREWDQARDDMRAILRENRTHYVATLRLAWLGYQARSYQESVSAYRKAARLRPRALEPQLGIMLPLMALERWDEADAAGRKVLRTDAKSYLARSRLAYIDYLRGRYRQAAARYGSVLQDYPSDLDMMLGLAWTNLKMGRKDQARLLFEQVLSIRSDNQSAKAGMKAAGA